MSGEDWKRMRFGVGDVEAQETDLPEKKLIKGVLYRAICDYTQCFMEDVRGNEGTVKERLRVRIKNEEEAKAWIYDDDPREWSFRWVCEAVDLDVNALRGALEKARELRRTQGVQTRVGRVKIN
jgi:hypothetical protein